MQQAITSLHEIDKFNVNKQQKESIADGCIEEESYSFNYNESYLLKYDYNIIKDKINSHKKFNTKGNAIFGKL